MLMNRSASALLISATLMIAGTSAQADTINTGRGQLAKDVSQPAAKKTTRALKATKSHAGKKKVRRARKAKASVSHGARRSKYVPLVHQLKPAGLPFTLVDAVITMESGYNASARGRHGEIGLMQVKPATARMVHSLTGVKAGSLTVPANNLRVGMAYLDWCYRRAKGKIGATIGCYNAGPGNMWKWQKFAVTRKYVRYVLSRFGGSS
jgi:soluble lytic murein transglycosylase-like protein